MLYIINKMSKCEHGKRKSRCIDCGGKDICEHGKYKYSCKECGGKDFFSRDFLFNIVK